MNDQWGVGDLALCIKTTGNHILHRQIGSGLLAMGGIYTVEAVIPFGIRLAGHYSSHRTGAWAHIWFRKIHPHVPDAEDVETIRLMKRRKAKA